MNHLRRLLVGIVAGFALVAVMGGSEAPAAAATNLFVNDTTANDPSPGYCTHGPSYPTIEAAVAALTTTSNVTITICPGLYNPPAGFAFTGYNNLKILGKGGPIINAPGGFIGALFRFIISSKVTVQGLNINGQGTLGASDYAVAIHFINTSGTIKGNTVSQWHQNYGFTPPYSATAATYGIVEQADPPEKKVTIQNNSIYDSQDVGIGVRSTSTKIIKNRVVFSSALNPAFHVGAVAVQVGILAQYSNKITISGNQVQSDSDLFPINGSSRGILLYSTSNSKVMKNTVRGTSNQISVESHCDDPSFPNASNNKVTGNKLYDSWNNGLVITASASGLGCANPHADFNTATGNKIYNLVLDSAVPYGALVLAVGSGAVIDRPTIKSNTFAGFAPGYHIYPATGAGGVISNPRFTPNKVLVVPPPGPLNVPSPVDLPIPGPLPASILNLF
jgi:hypothetical protein